MRTFRELCQEACDRIGLKGDPVELWKLGFKGASQPQAAVGPVAGIWFYPKAPTQTEWQELKVEFEKGFEVIDPCSANPSCGKADVECSCRGKNCPGVACWKCGRKV